MTLSDSEQRKANLWYDRFVYLFPEGKKTEFPEHQMVPEERDGKYYQSFRHMLWVSGVTVELREDMSHWRLVYDHCGWLDSEHRETLYKAKRVARLANV